MQDAAAEMVKVRFKTALDMAECHKFGVLLSQSVLTKWLVAVCCGVADVVKAAGHLQTADDDDSRLPTALLTAVVALERQYPAAFGRTLDQR